MDEQPSLVGRKPSPYATVRNQVRDIWKRSRPILVDDCHGCGKNTKVSSMPRHIFGFPKTDPPNRVYLCIDCAQKLYVR